LEAKKKKETRAAKKLQKEAEKVDACSREARCYLPRREQL
jgi:hypothetical protein